MKSPEETAHSTLEFIIGITHFFQRMAQIAPLNILYQMVPQIYAAIAIALHRTYGFGYKRINDIFVESQHIWEDYAGDGAGMVKKCEEETGVTVCSPEEAQRLMEMQNGMQ